MSSPSSSDLVATMQSVQTYLCRFVGPIFLFMGTVGCIVNLIIFTQKTLRRSPCSIYFIAYNIANFLYIYCVLLFLIVSLGYNIDPSIHSLVFCRLRLYSGLLFHCLSQFYLILASIDRMLVTSRNALTRRRSTHRLAYICIFIGAIFWALFHSHALIFPAITEIAPQYFICNFQQGTEESFVVYYTIMEETLLLSIMIICGLYSINNIRRVGRVRAALNEPVIVATVASDAHSPSSKDRQFVFMLIMDIIIYTLFSFVLAIFFMYQEITQNYVKSSGRIQVENNVRNLCFFCLNIPCCTSCYANLIVSKTFRNEVKKMFLWR